ncbi:MAG: VOC family protein [Candidatus Thorarchaeota archaeon]|jgi:catechol 2,3-dioxygenase-like lactoylglutathione lyase family enzyme
MLANASIHPTIPAVDLDRARKFYEEKLGLKVIRTDPSPGVHFQVGDGEFYIFQRPASKADHTLAAFRVDDAEAEIRGLQAKGVVFEDIDVPERDIKTVNGIATMGPLKGGWFKDTEGNTLGVFQMQK